MNQKLRQIIFKKLYEDLSHVEIIPYKDSIWFIDREKKYWYMEFEKRGNLWCRYKFFNQFFSLFSMEFDEFQWVISGWVEEVLNCEVKSPPEGTYERNDVVEEVLNCKVKSFVNCKIIYNREVAEGLNCKVKSLIRGTEYFEEFEVPDILDYKVNKTRLNRQDCYMKVEEVLKYKVNGVYDAGFATSSMANEIFNCK